MTVSVLPTRVTYAGATSPGTGPFAFQKPGGQPILVLSLAELVVKKYPAAGPIGTFVTLNPTGGVVDYTITTTPVTMGAITYLSCTITLAAGLVTGDLLVLERQTPAVQSFSPQFGGQNAFTAYENAWDAITKIVQEIEDQTGRALLVDDSWDGASTNVSRFNAKGLRVGGVQNALLPDEALNLGQLAAAVQTINPSITPVSSFMAGVLLGANSPAVRGLLGVQTSLSDVGASVGTHFFPLVPTLSDATTRANNTTSLQAAIDFAYTNGFKFITISAGSFYFNPPIYLDAPGNLRAPGQIQFTVNATAGQTITIASTVVTFVNSGATGNQVNLGGNLAGTLSNLLTFLQGSADSNLVRFTYTVVGNNLNVTAISGSPTTLSTNVSGATVSSGASAPTIFNFSLWLQGAGSSTQNARGTTLNFLDNTQPTLISGPGQQMGVSDFDLISQVSFTTRAALPANGMGLVIAGGSGGGAGFTAERCFFSGFRWGANAGWNNGSLAEHLVFRTCYFVNNYIGFQDFTSNSIIHDFDQCVFGANTYDFFNIIDHVININGGNYSSTNANAKALTVGSTTALVQFSDNTVLGTKPNWQFTTTLSAPSQPMTDGAFDSFVIKTTGFGLVPCQLISYNASTRVATLKLYFPWVSANYTGSGAYDLLNSSNLSNEIVAATTLYAAERHYSFHGSGFNIDGAHFESPGVVSTLVNATAGSFNSSKIVKINKGYHNYDPTQILYNSSGDNLAIFYNQQAFPYMSSLSSGTIHVDNMDWGLTGGGTTGAITLELGSLLTGAICTFKGNGSTFTPINVTTPVTNNLEGNSTPTWEAGMGSGIWDNTPFVPSGNTNQQMYRDDGRNPVPFYGWGPAPSAIVRFRKDQFTSIVNGPPAIGSTNPLFVPLHGQTLYSVVDGQASGEAASNFALATAFLFRSQHHYFSYGQNFSVNWSIEGQSHVLNVSDTSKFFAGLFIPSLPGAPAQQFIVTGVYPALGYVTVFPNYTNGTKGTTYNGVTINQEAYSITAIPFTAPAQYVTNASVGATTAAVGDLTGSAYCNLILSAIGAAAYTTRTAVQMFADLPWAYTGLSYELEIENTSSGNTTITGGTGVTITGQAAIPPNTKVLYEVTFTSPTAVSMKATDAAPFLTLPMVQSVVNSTGGATTAAVGDLTGAQITNLKLTAVGANSYTTRTATQMFGDLPGAYAGLSYELRIENTNAGTTTLAAGTGVTLTGTMTIAQNTTRIFTVTFNSSSTLTIESRGVLSSV